MFVYGNGLVELPFPLKIEGEIVEQVFHGFVLDRTLPEFFKGHVKHALALEGKPEHLVRFNAVSLDALLCPFGKKIAGRNGYDVADDKEKCGVHDLEPVPVLHKGEPPDG